MKNFIFVLVTSLVLVFGCESEKNSFDGDFEMIHVCRGDSTLECQKDSVCTKDSTVCVKDTL